MKHKVQILDKDKIPASPIVDIDTIYDKHGNKSIDLLKRKLKYINNIIKHINKNSVSLNTVNTIVNTTVNNVVNSKDWYIDYRRGYEYIKSKHNNGNHNNILYTIYDDAVYVLSRVDNYNAVFARVDVDIIDILEVNRNGYTMVNTTEVQSYISDLSTIRSNASKGATAVQPIDLKPIISDISTAQLTADDAQANASTAIQNAETAQSLANNAYDVARGMAKATALDNVGDLVQFIDNISKDELKIGDNIYLRQLNVPDVWISHIFDDYTPYEYTTDEAFYNAMKQTGFVKVAFYGISMLETQKVDLTEYATKQYVDNREWVGTEAEYNAIATKDPNITYMIVED